MSKDAPKLRNFRAHPKGQLKLDFTIFQTKQNHFVEESFFRLKHNCCQIQIISCMQGGFRMRNFFTNNGHFFCLQRTSIFGQPSLKSSKAVFEVFVQKKDVQPCLISLKSIFFLVKKLLSYHLLEKRPDVVIVCYQILKQNLFQAQSKNMQVMPSDMIGIV